MLTSTHIEAELLAYVRPYSADGQYHITVFAPYSSDVVASAVMTSPIKRSDFFTVESERAVFEQARTELSAVIGHLAQKLIFTTEHPNAD